MRTFISLTFVAGFLLITACTPQEPVTDIPSQVPVTSGDDAEEGDDMHGIPVPAGVSAARAALAVRLNVEPNSILILEAHKKDWSDGCLGLGGPAESCLAAITPGYDVLLRHQGTEYRYRTNLDGSSVRAED